MLRQAVAEVVPSSCLFVLDSDLVRWRFVHVWAKLRSRGHKLALLIDKQINRYNATNAI